MKVSDLTITNIKQSIRIDFDDDDSYIETIIMPSVKAYIKGYTGLDDISIDLYEDITTAYIVLCSDMYNNRDYAVQNDRVNLVVKSILNLHCVDLL